MKKAERLQKLLAKKSDLENRLYEEKLREHQRIKNMGWGYGMRHAKLNFSTTKEDRLQARIEKIDKQIAELQGEGS